MLTYIEKANRYIDAVLTEKIPACLYVKRACQRQLDDLKKSTDKAYPYYFNENKANRVCRFLELLVHVKGEWARHKKRFILSDWQVFILTCIFGWLKKKNDYRRFREAYIEVARKNGKSFKAAGIGLYMLCADNEVNPEVLCGATKETQALQVFVPAKQTVITLGGLRRRFSIGVYDKRLTLPDGGFFSPLVGIPGDGSNPSCSIIDEFHEHASPVLYDTMVTGQGSRQQALNFIITTAGFNLSGPCFEMHNQVAEMLEADNHDDSLFYIIYTLDREDDWTEEKNLIKANPNYEISVYADYLKTQLKKAIANPSFTNTFKTKNLNLWVTSSKNHFNIVKWHNLKEDKINVDEFKKTGGYLGLDLARKLDLNSLVPIFRTEDENHKIHYHITGCKFWIPEESIPIASRFVRSRFEMWINQGYLQTVPGSEMDYRVIKKEILRFDSNFPLAGISIDPHGATCLLHELDDENLKPIAVTQTFKNLSTPMKELEAAIESNRIHHDGNPLLSWCISNVMARYSPGNDDLIRPVRYNIESKIDGAVALIMAIGHSINKKQTTLSQQIELHGIRQL